MENASTESESPPIHLFEASNNGTSLLTDPALAMDTLPAARSLIIPYDKESFNKLTYNLAYTKFPVKLADINGKDKLARKEVEEAWKGLILARFKQWRPPADVSHYEMKQALKMAFNQVRDIFFLFLYQ
jgi:hypothetical protein